MIGCLDFLSPRFSPHTSFVFYFVLLVPHFQKILEIERRGQAVRTSMPVMDQWL